MYDKVGSLCVLIWEGGTGRPFSNDAISNNKWSARIQSKEWRTHDLAIPTKGRPASTVIAGF